MDEAHHSREETGRPAGQAPHYGMAAFSARGAAAHCTVAAHAECPPLHCCVCLETPDSHMTVPDPRALPAETTMPLQRVLSVSFLFLSSTLTFQEARLSYKAPSRARHDHCAQCRFSASVASHRLEV